MHVKILDFSFPHLGNSGRHRSGPKMLRSWPQSKGKQRTATAKFLSLIELVGAMKKQRRKDKRKEDNVEV